jgi:hypothetical protein
MKVGSDDEALRLMNDSPYGLTASLWTGDTDRAWDVARRIETGTVFLNRADYLDPAVCWTGCKDTGRGVEHVERGRGDRQAGQRPVGDQQRPGDAGGPAMLGQFRDPAGAELDSGGIGPVGGGGGHAFTLRKW